MSVLKNLLYTEEHEWLKVEGNKVYIGITDYAQKALGSIVYVELPEVDEEFSKGEVFGVVESVKAASDIFIPVTGKILEANEDTVDDPSLINSAAYDNWLICVELQDEAELEGLMKAEEYEDFCSKEE
ncbi:glycine cleavage system H protein [Clostridium amylolyticum]|uniref:Glycine cleavage system H protein n=1 Tax=Clostridium amylolyticum TaxID=1121298 RepID=A0A1M6INX5_9CLOT|nr:glycine cleavage system protein GcvH [Clostridium amylolyticum]SHJ36155.1 glycine cleavage system H protein [Clostridium amylolyticum]